jgi:hypothetical protein
MTEEKMRRALEEAARRLTQAAAVLEILGQHTAALGFLSDAKEARAALSQEGLVAGADGDETAVERKRCAEIVQLARFGEMDTDFRSIINAIESGKTVEEIKSWSA